MTRTLPLLLAGIVLAACGRQESARTVARFAQHHNGRDANVVDGALQIVNGFQFTKIESNASELVSICDYYLSGESYTNWTCRFRIMEMQVPDYDEVRSTMAQTLTQGQYILPTVRHDHPRDNCILADYAMSPKGDHPLEYVTMLFTKTKSGGVLVVELRQRNSISGESFIAGIRSGRNGLVESFMKDSKRIIDERSQPSSAP